MKKKWALMDYDFHHHTIGVRSLEVTGVMENLDIHDKASIEALQSTVDGVIVAPTWESLMDDYPRIEDCHDLFSEISAHPSIEDISVFEMMMWDGISTFNKKCVFVLEKPENRLDTTFPDNIPTRPITTIH